MSLYNNENENENNKKSILSKAFPKEILQDILNELLNKRLTKLENSSKNQISDLTKISKNFQEFSNHIQQISNNILEKNKSTEENKNIGNNEPLKLNINNNANNILKHSIKKLPELGNDIIITTKKNNNVNNLRTRSNTLGINKYNQLKKQNTEVNLNRESFNSNHIRQKSKLKSPEKNNNKINKNINITKDFGKNATPKKNNKMEFIVENKQIFPQTEKIPKKINEKIKKQNTNNKNIKNNNIDNKYMNEFDNLNIGFNKQIIIDQTKKEIKEKNKIKKNIIIANKKLNDNYIKNEFDIEKKNKNGFNNLRTSFYSKKDKKLILKERNNTMNNSTNLNDIQSIVKLVDNVNQNITKILNDNNSNEIFIPNNLRNSVKLSKEKNNLNNLNNINIKKGEFTLKKKYLTKKEKVININAFEIFKKEKKILKNILKYLTENDLIFFYSMNNYFNKERIAYFDNKKEDLLSILNLKKEETIENKINEIKKEFNKEKLLQIKKFELSENLQEKIKLINTREFLNEILNREMNNISGNIITIYKIFFVFFGEEKIYSTLNADIFWKKCYNYFNEKCKGNIGNFILNKIQLFNFKSKEFNKIRNLLKENKNEIINEISDSENCLMSLIKELFEYFGIIFSKDKTEGNIYIHNLKRNQIIINYLNNLKVRYFLSKYNEEEEDD